MLQRRRTELGNAHAIGNDIDSAAGETVVAHNFVAYHRRVSNHASCAALAQQRFFYPQDAVVFAIKPAPDSLQRILKLRSAVEPRLMNTVASTEKIAAPDPLQTYHEITMFGRIAVLEFVGERDWVIGTNAYNLAEGPFFLWPILCRK